MKTQFEQRRYVWRKAFTLLEDGVRVRERGPRTGRSFKVAFEEIPVEPAEVTTSSTVAFWGLLFSGFLFLLSILMYRVDPAVDISAPFTWGLLTAGFAVSFWMSRATYLIYGDERVALELFRDQPNAVQVDMFMDVVQEARKTYLRKRYWPAPTEDPAFAIERFAWLRSQGALSETELDALTQEVTQRGSAPNAGWNVFLN